MKLLLLIACLLLVACVHEYDGSGTLCDQLVFWQDEAMCYKDYSKKLEMEVEILKVKMEYGCKAKEFE